MPKFNYKIEKSWIKGSYGKYEYQAKLVENTTKGIAGSKVERLNVFYNGLEVVNYDKCWFINKAESPLVRAIVLHLEKVSEYRFNKVRNYMKGMF